MITLVTRRAKVADIGPCQVCNIEQGKPVNKKDEVFLITFNRLQIKLCNVHRIELKNGLSESRNR